MANSSIRLYYVSSGAQWELLPHKLYVVEDIEAYLATKTYNNITSFQYIKPQLEISITVDLSQTYAEPLNGSYKYVRIENSDQASQYYYYFVKNVIWRSKSSVRFDLVMDVLNTFKETIHYNFKPNTRIIREHKDRFVAKNISVVLEYEVLSSAGTININDTVRVFYEVGGIERNILEGTVTDIGADYCVISVADSYSIEDIKRGFATPANSRYITRDNMNYIQIGDFDLSFEYDTFKNIDYVAENINPLLQCGNSKGTIINNTKTLLDCDWYLLYRNQNNPTDSLVNPVDCFLIPEKTTNIFTGSVSNGRILPSSINANTWYYVRLPSGYTATLPNGVVFDPNTSPYINCLIITKQKENLISLSAIYRSPSSPHTMNLRLVYDDLEYIAFSGFPIPYYSSTSQIDIMIYSNNIYGNETQEWSTYYAGAYIDSVDILDRTDAKNIKLIKLPYCPYDFTISSSKIDITSSNWNYEDLEQANGSHIHCLKLTDLNTNLRGSLSLSIVSKNPLINLKMTFTPSINNRRLGLNYETKLLNSEFYRPTYVYDSFSYVIQMEKLDIDYYLVNRDITVYFDMTKTINSRFMFTFDSLEFKLSNESYAKYMPIARNNEEVLYNVPYINYIRTGFNYDVKSKTVSNVSNWIGTGLSLAGVGASLLLPSAPLKALGVVTSLISMAMTTKNAIVSTIQNEENFARKQQELKNQTASVEGSDDVDLMSIYAENRLKYLVYEPNDVMKNMLFDLFFYAGYASNRLGLPNHNTRYNFDYLEADVVLEKIANIPDDCLEELINTFKNGVTYIHKTNRTGTSKWDFKQEYENWEKFLV